MYEYERPRVQRFGTLREMTKLGPDLGNDFTSILGDNSPGCNAQDTESDFGCGRS